MYTGVRLNIYVRHFCFLAPFSNTNVCLAKLYPAKRRSVSWFGGGDVGYGTEDVEAVTARIVLAEFMLYLLGARMVVSLVMLP